MTSLLAVRYETRLGYDSHLESSQIWSGPKAWDCFLLIIRVLHHLMWCLVGAVKQLDITIVIE